MISWIILVVGLFMFIGLMLILPAHQEAIIIGQNLTGYTANTTYWLGFTESMGFIPIVLITLAILVPVYAWWKAKSYGE